MSETLFKIIDRTINILPGCHQVESLSTCVLEKESFKLRVEMIKMQKSRRAEEHEQVKDHVVARSLKLDHAI